MHLSSLLATSAVALILVPLSTTSMLAQERKDSAATPIKSEYAVPDGPEIVKREIRLSGKAFAYVSTTGMMPIRSETGEIEGKIFYMAYTKPGAVALKRPLTFAFNGGPGSASVWLHLGALGPRKVEMPDLTIPSPPYRIADNPHTWLDETDLVFIDPVGTGFSRATKPELNKKFHGLKGDVDSVGEFIRSYLTRNDRWGSPLFLVGESYGTTRAAGLAGRLIEKGIAFNGIILISAVLNFQTLQFDSGNDLPYILFLPTYTATAWHHKKLAPDLQADLKKAIDASIRWAETDYARALFQGDRLTPAERSKTAAELSRLTGLGRDYVEKSDLRVSIMRFCKELLRDRSRTVGRLDSRFVGTDSDGVGATPDFDPSMAAIRPPYTSAFHQYVRTDLNYKTDLPYNILGEGVGAWDYGLTGRQGYPEVAESLRSGFDKNPSMRILVASGYYDLAPPFRAIEFTLAHMNLPEAMRKRIDIKEYPAGHMMYVHPESLEKLKRDVAEFLRAAVQP